MEQKLQNIYQEILETINQMIPEEWEKFYFYAQISDTGGGNYFYYSTPQKPKEYQYSLEIPFNFAVDDDSFTELRRHLFNLSEKMREIFKKHDQELWYSFTRGNKW